MKRWSVTACAVFSALAVVGCSSPEPDAELSLEGDVVRIPAGALEALEPTPLEPILVIDGDDESRGPLLSYIADVARTPEGQILILDGADQAVHLYGPTGEFVRTLGGRGEGPGEFTQASFLAVVGDTLAVWEFSNRLHLFALDGAHLGTERVESGGPDQRWTGVSGIVGTEAGVFATRLSLPPGALGPVPDSELKPFWHSVLVQRLDLAVSQFDSLHVVTGRYVPVVSRAGLGLELFGAAVPSAISGNGRVVRVPGDRFSIEWLDSTGAVDRTVVAETERRRVTSDEVDRVIQLSLSQMPPEMQGEFDGFLRNLPVAEYHTAIIQLLGGSSERVLVLRSDIGPVVDITAQLFTGLGSADHTWDFLTRDGELLGRFLVAPENRPLLLRDGYLHAIRTSPLGVPSLVVFDLLGDAR